MFLMASFVTQGTSKLENQEQDESTYSGGTHHRS